MIQVESFLSYLSNSHYKKYHSQRQLRLSDNELSLGAPVDRPTNGEYLTKQGVFVQYTVESDFDKNFELNKLIEDINNQHGVLLTSSYEYPGRYSRWTVGFTSPAIQIEGRELNFSITALNDRGRVINKIIHSRLVEQTNLFTFVESSDEKISGNIIPSNKYFTEEERSKQASLFSLIRAISDIFYHEKAGQSGLYGSFGYDLTFQFENIELHKSRDQSQRDLVLYFPDEILIVDNQKKDSWKIKYEFTDTISQSLTTINKSKTLINPISFEETIKEHDKNFKAREYEKGEYSKLVDIAKEQFRVGNLFEVVLSQSFREKTRQKPSEIFKRLCKRNPSPYGFFMNLGNGEYLVGASPEMFVRVERTTAGLRVETCPISGTIQRGGDALEDAQQIKKLLLSAKEESELTMCTDVDRNDKSRICIPGSVKVLGRRQIEMYSRLIHTVDHVEGYLRPEFDSLDAFLCHTWAVTVTGAPKTWAIRWLESVEATPRHWYGGAVGLVGFDGTLNTGLTLRTIRIQNGIAEVRAGATLLYDSDPSAEEAETELKASALIDAVIRDDRPEQLSLNFEDSSSVKEIERAVNPSKVKVLLIDHEDSFVHTLANYFRQSNADVITCRSGSNFDSFMSDMVKSGKFIPDIAVLSPGPGSPSDFGLGHSISTLIDHKIPIFGVCLGLQGITEYFGGKLDVLTYPMHGKPSNILRIQTPETEKISKSNILNELPEEFQVGRYHSLHANIESFPNDLLVTAVTQEGCVMALQHKKYPIAAVQFHPESILTLPTYGLQIITNVLELLKSSSY